MQDRLYRTVEYAQDEMSLRSFVRFAWAHRDVQLSTWCACLLLAWDVGVTGSFGASVLCCPIWFLMSLVRSAIERVGWRLTLVRTAIPAVTLAVVLANNAVQKKIAEANATRVVTACEEFHAGKGAFPKSLDELVPDYLPSVPRAKYCLLWGNFTYLNYQRPILLWYVFPPFGRRSYDFDERQWHVVD